MTILQRLNELASAFADAFRDGDTGQELAEIEAEIEVCICAGLGPYMSGAVKKLNNPKPSRMTRARSSSRAA